MMQGGVPGVPDDYASDIEAMNIAGAVLPPASRTLRWVVLVVAVLVLAVTVLVVVVRSQPEPGPPHPDSWDPRVAPYVKIVQEQRGLVFERPVYVDFLDIEDFRQQLTSRSAEMTEATIEEVNRNVSLLQALGLVSGHLDVFNEQDQLRGSGVLGYYSYNAERISLRSSEVTPAIESVLVRELTHALEDQRFDVGARWSDLEADPAKRTAVLTLVEGDVDRVESGWRESLTPEAAQALDDDVARLAPGSDGAARVPAALRSLVGIPAEFGEALIAVVDERRGARGVDNLFLTPPITQEQLMDPWALVQDHQGHLGVAEPELADDEERIQGGALGAITWLVMLAERLPAYQALEAADGWGGDAYVTFARDGLACVRAEYAGDTPEDVAQMKTALDEWVGGSADSASVRREGRRLTFESCAQASTASTAGNGGSRDAVALAVARSNLSLGLLGGEVDTFDARCAADRLARELTAEVLDDLRLKSPEVRRELAFCQSSAPGKGSSRPRP